MAGDDEGLPPRHVLCVGVGGDRTHAARPGGAGYVRLPTRLGGEGLRRVSAALRTRPPRRGHRRGRAGLEAAADEGAVPVEAVAEDVGDGLADGALVVPVIEGQVEEGEGDAVHVHVADRAAGAVRGGAGGGVVGVDDVGEAPLGGRTAEHAADYGVGVGADPGDVDVWVKSAEGDKVLEEGVDALAVALESPRGLGRRPGWPVPVVYEDVRAVRNDGIELPLMRVAKLVVPEARHFATALYLLRYNRVASCWLGQFADRS
jgi:hypothetical protein